GGCGGDGDGDGLLAAQLPRRAASSHEREQGRHGHHAVDRPGGRPQRRNDAAAHALRHGPARDVFGHSRIPRRGRWGLRQHSGPDAHAAVKCRLQHPEGPVRARYGAEGVQAGEVWHSAPRQDALHPPPPHAPRHVSAQVGFLNEVFTD
ncbi:hypothetical protein T492DRAFT_900782, partial [Pavlovales sp. CCMP2436]